MPGTQGMGAVRPAEGQYEPLVHGLQLERPPSGSKEPAGQRVRLEPSCPVHCAPGAQGSDCDAKHNAPWGQGVGCTLAAAAV